MEKEEKNNFIKNKNKTNLNKNEKKDILIYSFVFIASIVFMIIIILSFIKGFKKNKEDINIKYQKELPNLENKFEENTYINDRKIKNEELYTKNYNFFLKNQLKQPKLGDTILEVKFENYDPIKFKIFKPNVPKLALDLEKGIENGKLNGKKVNNIGTDKYIYINNESSEKIWTIYGRNGMDLKLIPIYGSLIAGTNKKYGKDNFGGTLKIVTSKENQEKFLKDLKYPNEIQEIAKKYNGTIAEDYGKSAVIGQIYQGIDTLMKLEEDLTKLKKEDNVEVGDTEAQVINKKSTTIEYAKIYEFEG